MDVNEKTDSPVVALSYLRIKALRKISVLGIFFWLFANLERQTNLPIRSLSKKNAKDVPKDIPVSFGQLCAAMNAFRQSMSKISPNYEK